jgi:Spy/CpxP family protein refolding chaperone
MTIRLLFAASLIAAASFSLTARTARAQDASQATAAATPTSGAQTMPAPAAPSSPGSSSDRPWTPRRDWDRGDRSGPDRGRDRGCREGRNWAHDDGRGDAMLPFGMWWKNPDIAARIGLTAEQQKRIGDLFLQSRVQLIHLHATLQEQQLFLGPLLDATPFDQAKAMAQIDKIADTRADLEKTNAGMLLNIRGILTADQWTKLRTRSRGMRRPGDRSDKGPQVQPASN